LRRAAARGPRGWRFLSSTLGSGPGWITTKAANTTAARESSSGCAGCGFCTPGPSPRRPRDTRGGDMARYGRDFHGGPPGNGGRGRSGGFRYGPRDFAGPWGGPGPGGPWGGSVPARGGNPGRGPAGPLPRGRRRDTGESWGGGSAADRVRAADVMTPNPEVVTPDTPLQEVASRMRELDVGVIPVVDDLDALHLRGVITDRDIA